ncbi:MAG: PaaI family thioesterase [Mycobacteriales bacterium]|nr:PaaI family thioesterase [Frankia sp.]
MTTTLPPPDAQAPTRHPAAPAPGTVLPPHYAQCFGCGDEHPTGLHLQVTVGEGVSVRAEFVVTADHQGAPGLAHGGVLASALDEGLGYLLWLLAQPAVTGRLEVDYLRPVPVGSTLAIYAECVGVSGRKIYTRGTGTVDGKTVLRANALYVAVPLEHFVDHGWRDAVATHGGETYNP